MSLEGAARCAQNRDARDRHEQVLLISYDIQAHATRRDDPPLGVLSSMGLWSLRSGFQVWNNVDSISPPTDVHVTLAAWPYDA